MRTRSFHDLIVWQRAMALTRVCYDLARRLPREERFELASQMRRAATSVAANIAEGHESPHRPVLLRYLGIAHGSLTELECHLLVCEQVGYLAHDVVEDALALSGEVSRMLRAMHRTLGDATPRMRSGESPRA